MGFCSSQSRRVHDAEPLCSGVQCNGHTCSPRQQLWEMLGAAASQAGKHCQVYEEGSGGQGQDCRVLLWNQLAFRGPPALLGAGEQDKAIAGDQSQLHSSSVAPEAAASTAEDNSSLVFDL